VGSEGTMRIMRESDREAAVAEFIRKKGITRCPTACVLPTQGSVAEADRALLEAYAISRDRTRRAKVAARAQLLWFTDTLMSREK
jgi:hypothetical protein